MKHSNGKNERICNHHQAAASDDEEEDDCLLNVRFVAPVLFYDFSADQSSSHLENGIFNFPISRAGRQIIVCLEIWLKSGCDSRTQAMSWWGFGREGVVVLKSVNLQVLRIGIS